MVSMAKVNFGPSVQITRSPMLNLSAQKVQNEQLDTVDNNSSLKRKFVKQMSYELFFVAYEL
jgi:hypothetical protein